MANGQESEEVRRFKATLEKAKQGDAEAQNNLGVMYYEGEVVPANAKEAAKWFRMAAEQGHKWAQNNLGVAYRDGKGVPQDDEEAVKWFRKAAEQGHAEAQYGLGMMYTKGEGMPKNYVEAAKWSRKAAEQGIAWAQVNLGVLYYGGLGVPKNDVEAYAWHLLAKANEDEAFSEMIFNLEKRLTAEQIEKGQARAAALHRLIKERKENPKPSVESP